MGDGALVIEDRQSNVLLARRVVDLVLLLSWRISFVFMLSMNMMVLSNLRRRLLILTRNLTMHTCLINPFLNFIAKRFLVLTSLSASVCYVST